MNNKKHINIVLDPTLLKQVKMHFAMNDMNNLSKLVEDLLREWLIKQK